MDKVLEICEWLDPVLTFAMVGFALYFMWTGTQDVKEALTHFSPAAKKFVEGVATLIMAYMFLSWAGKSNHKS